MHAAADNLRGGVSPRGTLLRGQSIIEYVLIIAVIGLVVVFAGPGVAGAIRNQFNQVTNTVDAGTEGDSFMSAEEKAYREAMKTVVNKEAKDWTLDEQKAAATDIAKNGTSSVVYAKARAAMEAGTTWSVRLTRGGMMPYRIIGINHDDLADDSSKAGLTFEAITGAMGTQRINDAGTKTGGWEKSEVRGRFNSGDLWSKLPTDFQTKIRSVKKVTDNQGTGATGNRNVTIDKLFLLSRTEIWGDSYKEGSQYEYYAFKGVTASSCSGARGNYRWTRSVNPSWGSIFYRVNGDGSMGSNDAADTNYAQPAWCF